MKVKKRTKLYEWQERCRSGNESCAKCGEKRGLTVDHVVPCHILEQFALDKIDLLYEMEDNFEILCLYCNKMKAGQIDVRNPKTYTILYRVMKNAETYHIIQSN